MKNQKITTIDDLGRILLPASLYTQLEWKKECKITARISETNKALELLAEDRGQLQLDPLNRIALDKGTCQALGWSRGNKITVTPDTGNGILKLTL